MTMLQSTIASMKMADREIIKAVAEVGKPWWREDMRLIEGKRGTQIRRRQTSSPPRFSRRNRYHG